MNKILSILLLICIMTTFASCSETSSDSAKSEVNEIVATIVTKSGEKKQMTFDEIKELEENNLPLFEKEFYGASIEFSGEILKIGGQYSFWGIYNADAYLEIGDSDFEVWFVEISENDALNYNIGDTVKVKGVLSTANGGASFRELYIFEEGGVSPVVTKI